MKRIVTTLYSLLLLGSAAAQTPEGEPLPAFASRTEWLSSFDAVDIDGDMRVEFRRTDKDKGPHIVYDTKGDFTTKFSVAVDKNGTLRIEERIDPKRTTTTEVIIYYHSLSSIKTAHADVSFAETLDSPITDIYVSGGANFTAEVDVKDLKMEVMGKSRVVLSGSARYFSLSITTAKFDGENLSTLSSTIDASHLAEVRLTAGERLEASTATSARIEYRGKPEIIRLRNSLFGGEIIASEQ